MYYFSYKIIPKLGILLMIGTLTCESYPQSRRKDQRESDKDSNIIQILIQYPEAAKFLYNRLRPEDNVYGVDEYGLPTNQEDNFKIDERVIQAFVNSPETVQLLMNFYNKQKTIQSRIDNFEFGDDNEYIGVPLVPIPRK